MIPEQKFPLLHRIISHWADEPERPPLLVNGLTESETGPIFEAIVKYFFQKAVAAGHPDVLILERDPKKTGIDVDRTREFIAQLALSHFEFTRKLGLIPEAHRLNPASQNALLKTLEEPLPNRYLILGTASKNLLLPTILSRATIVNLPQSAPAVDGELRDNYRQWVRSGPAQRLKKGELWSENRPEKIKQFFDFAIQDLRQRLAESLSRRDAKKARQLTGQLTRALSYSEQLHRTSGANPKLLLESFLLNLS